MAIDIININYRDIAAREREARAAIKGDLDRLTARKAKLGGTLSAVDQAEFDRLTALLPVVANQRAYLDPLFAAVRATFAGNGAIRALQVEHDADGDIMVRDQAANVAVDDTTREEAPRIAYILGLLQRDHVPLPPVISAGGRRPQAEPDTSHENWALFSEGFYRILGRASGNAALARAVLTILADESDGAGAAKPEVSTLEFAKVMEKLIADKVSATEPQLGRRVSESLDKVQAVGDDRPLHDIEIQMTNLEAVADYAIVKDHVRLAGPMIFASMFDELRAFQSLDVLIDLSQRGTLNLGRGPAGTQLYKLWREAPNRMSESERQAFYAITLGIPGGPVDGMVNTDFQDLWLRFVSSVSSLIRENRVDQLLRSSLPASVNQQQVKKAARDLGTNLSMHGYGMSYYAAVDLQNQINDMINLFSQPELMSQFGAHDMWGLLDYLAQTYCGGARNSSKYRTLATCGAIITTWLANNIDRLKDPTLPIINLAEVENPPARGSGESATSNPTDYDLVNACELWLADMAANDQRVQEMVQPRESPAGPSRPIQIPTVAQDLLDQAGIGLGMSAGNGGIRANGGYGAY
jgi:hypothetical protein